MIYSLDTNVCIRYLNGRSPSVKIRLQSMVSRDIVVCSLVRAELFYGAARSQTPERSQQRHEQFLRPYATLAFDDNAAQSYGEIRAYLESQGLSIGPLDMAIAAIAVANNMTLVTHNTREFSRVPGLKLEDWETD